MNVLMMTNTFTPFVGGVTRSVETFTQSFRRAGHRVLVVAPACDGAPEMETDVIRVPAVQNFNGTDFSVMLPVPGFLSAAVERFDPDIVHSHHPFLLGGTALRLARMRGLPLVFTHHTLYDRYTHYVPGDSSTLRRLAATLSTSYAAICDQVFAPSESVAEMLRMRGVTSPIDVVPTGVPVGMLRRGSGEGFRAAMGIPQDACVIGHVGRLAREKNLDFLCEAAIRVLARRPDAHLLLVGAGPIMSEFRMRMAGAGVGQRVHMPGTLVMPLLASAYRAMDVFAFTSRSETQGLVIAEALAAGVPVVALDASGVREAVADGRNGRVVPVEDADAFAAAIGSVADLPPSDRAALQAAARATGDRFAEDICAARAMELYARACAGHGESPAEPPDPWVGALRAIRDEWAVLKRVARGH